MYAVRCKHHKRIVGAAFGSPQTYNIKSGNGCPKATYKKGDVMKYLLIAGTAIIILAISIFIGYKMPVKEMTEQEKTMKAIRILIYIIIGLIISGVIIKILMIYDILNL